MKANRLFGRPLYAHYGSDCAPGWPGIDSSARINSVRPEAAAPLPVRMRGGEGP